MTATLDVAVVGAGFSGLAAGLALAADGWRFRIFERGSAVGGIWRDTRYPGAACDVPSMLYCLANRPNPDWSQRFAGRAEIHAYLTDVARELEDHISLNSQVDGLHWEGNAWRLEIGGTTVRARAVLLALGPQSRPRRPDYPGLADFTGSWCHSSAWNDSWDLSGRHVAVIGAGASAVQIVPAFAGTAARVTAIQRTPAWVLPRGDRQRPAWRRRLGRALPMLDRLERGARYWQLEALGLGNLGNRPMAALVERVALAKLAREVPDPATRALLRPDYRLGCKRIMVSDDYWPAFARPDVTLLRGALAGFDRDGPILADGRRIAADHVVFATGYHVADADGLLPVGGVAGHRLPELWMERGVSAYLGTVAAGFPNLAFLLGPNSGLSHSSAVHVAESQIAYVRQWLRLLAQRGPIMPDAARQADYNQWLAGRLPGTVWASGCSSWFLDRQGRNSVIYPGLTAGFRRRLRKLNPADFVDVEA